MEREQQEQGQEKRREYELSGGGMLLKGRRKERTFVFKVISLTSEDVNFASQEVEL